MLLLQDLRSGRIPITSEMEPRDVYLQRLEFAEFDGNYKNFPGRLRDARKQIICKNSRSALDSAALAHDREIYPKAAYNHRGEPRWEWSEAERLLRQDMDEGKHKTMKPQLVYQLRKEYNENYTLKTFRQHIYQEEKRRKFDTQYYGSHNNRNNL